MKKKNWTFRGFIMTIIVFLMVIFELVAISGSTIISRNLKKQRKETYASALEIYTGNLSDELKLIDDFMLSAVMMEGYARDVVESTTETDKYLAEVKMKNSFVDDTRHMYHLSGVVWYARDMDIRVKMIKNSLENGFEEDFQNNPNAVIEKMNKEEQVDWFFYEVNGHSILVRVLENQDTYMVGWINTENIFRDIRETLSKEKAILYLNIRDELCQDNNVERENASSIKSFEGKNSDTIEENGKIYQLIFPQNDYPVSLCLALQENNFYHWLANPYFFVPLVIFITGGIIVFLFCKLTKYFIRPMDSLREAMIKMQQGDFDVRMDDSTAFYEFTLLNANFDKMAEKIKELKIEVYEKQLEKQTVELNYLQHQINPHFLTNCMNTIRNLLVMGKSEQAEEFTTLLSKNIRYDLSTKVVIPLEDEINHVKNYIALQQVRYENQLKLSLHVEKNLGFCEVPNMVIQTFVENSVKHEVCPDEILMIDVSVLRENGELHIEIEDNGDGFEPEVLYQLRAGKAIIKNGVEHIGIENVVQRLRIMYQGRASISFANSNRGALVRIVLPIEEYVGKYHG